MKLATTTADFTDYVNDGLEAIELIALSGFKYIDYSFSIDRNCSSGVFGTHSNEYVALVKQKITNQELNLVQAHSPMGRPIVCDDKREAFVADTKQCIRCCGEWGIKNLVVHSGYEQGITKEECFEKNKKFYLDLLKVAEQYDVNILTENFNPMCVENCYWIDNAIDLRALIDFVDHPLFHACWDIGHANMQPMIQEDELKIVGKHVYGIHVQDNMGDNDSHTAPFFGTADMDSVMTGLGSIGYQGYFTFEATRFLPNVSKIKKADPNLRLFAPSVDLKSESEKFLYQIGKYILRKYGLYEE